jgi:hypothetical protein
VKILKRDKQFLKKYTLCIDIENVFLDEIDQNENVDMYKMEHTTNISQNFIVLKKQGYK